MLRKKFCMRNINYVFLKLLYKTYEITKQPIKVDRNNNLAADENCKLMKNRNLVFF